MACLHEDRVSFIRGKDKAAYKLHSQLAKDDSKQWTFFKSLHENEAETVYDHIYTRS